MARNGIPNLSRLALFLTLASVFLTGTQISVFASDVKCEIELTENKLTAKIENAPLGTVLEKIREKTGTVFEIAEDYLESPVSANFQGLTQEEGLKVVLDRYNFVLLGGSGGKVEKVVVTSLIDRTSSGRVNNVGTNQVGAMIVSPSSAGGMKIIHGKDSMVVAPPSKEGMAVVHSPGTMVVGPPKKAGM